MTATTNDDTTPAPDDDAENPEAPEALADAAEPDQPDADEPDEPDEASPNREAAKWRTKLRAAEAERDALAERLNAYQRREVETSVADVLAAPGDLFDVGHAEIASFYTDSGELDAAAVRAAAEALVADRPGLAAGAVLPDKRKQWGQFTSGPPPEKTSWRQVL